MRHTAVMIAALGLWACGENAPKTDDKTAGSATPKSAVPSDAPAKPQTLVIYAGRSAKLVKPLIKEFEASSKITVKVREGKSGALAALLLEEKSASPADVFWAQDAGSLGQVEKAGLFGMRPTGTQKVIDHFSAQSARWVPVSGRARVLAYAPGKIAADALPKSVFDLTDPKYKGQVGWAPTNASFQAFVTAMRVKHGAEKTAAWLKGMQANDAKKYPKNTPIIRALAAGEIQLGLPNHYYLLREKSKDANYPVAQQFFADGDIGNLVNVSGIGVLKAGKNQAAAAQFVQFLLSKSAQTHFATKTFEYPVVPGIKQNANLVSLDALTKKAPQFELKRLEDLKATRDLLRTVGLL